MPHRVFLGLLAAVLEVGVFPTIVDSLAVVVMSVEVLWGFVVEKNFLKSILNEEAEFKIPTTRTHNDSLFCCALLRGTTRWSSCLGWSSGAVGLA